MSKFRLILLGNQGYTEKIPGYTDPTTTTSKISPTHIRHDEQEHDLAVQRERGSLKGLNPF